MASKGKSNDGCVVTCRSTDSLDESEDSKGTDVALWEIRSEMLIGAKCATRHVRFAALQLCEHLRNRSEDTRSGQKNRDLVQQQQAGHFMVKCHVYCRSRRLPQHLNFRLALVHKTCNPIVLHARPGECGTFEKRQECEFYLVKR